MPTSDRIYQTPLDHIDGFRFDEPVAQVFTDMITRSVPGYQALLAQMAVLARYSVPARGVCYDLGCSLGAVSFTLKKAILHADAKIIAIDNSAAMIKRAQAANTRSDGQVPIEFMEQDILATAFQPCHLVIANFTLQFIAPTDRLLLLQRIYKALLPGGMLIIADKICFDDPKTQQIQDRLHLNFKRQQGYSELEIAQKRAALENVLVPDTSEQQLARLAQAGFSEAVQWFQCFNFAAFLGCKGH